mgnify:CR=1 FL=1|tara:strand:+ start:1645 stop:1827 length:183 start_codon:yes stop_codon:yes gene_type:complete
MTSVLVLSSLSRIREIGNNRFLTYSPDLGDTQLQSTHPIPESVLSYYGVSLGEYQGKEAL